MSFKGYMAPATGIMHGQTIHRIRANSFLIGQGLEHQLSQPT
jgi:hypothetical protein